MRYFTIVLDGDMDETLHWSLFSHWSEREEAVGGGDDTRRRTGTSRGKVGGRLMEPVRAFDLRRGAPSGQSNMGGIEDRVEESVRRVC